AIAVTVFCGSPASVPQDRIIGAWVGPVTSSVLARSPDARGTSNTIVGRNKRMRSAAATRRNHDTFIRKGQAISVSPPNLSPKCGIWERRGQDYAGSRMRRWADESLL